MRASELKTHGDWTDPHERWGVANLVLARGDAVYPAAALRRRQEADQAAHTSVLYQVHSSDGHA